MKLGTNIYIFSLFQLLSFLRSSNADKNPCDNVNCGQGTCRESHSISDLILGFTCDCYTGWTKYQLGPIVVPTCIIPNCTLNSSCGTGPPLPPPVPPPFDLSDPCTYNWCGDGSCKTNEIGFECDCNDGSDNLLHMPTFPCFEECAIGTDCNSVQLGKPPTSSSHGLRELIRASKIEDSLKFLLILVPLLQIWI